MAGQETRGRFFTARSHCLLAIKPIILAIFFRARRERREDEAAQADNSLKWNQEHHLLVYRAFAVHSSRDLLYYPTDEKISSCYGAVACHAGLNPFNGHPLSFKSLTGNGLWFINEDCLATSPPTSFLIFLAEVRRPIDSISISSNSGNC